MNRIILDTETTGLVENPARPLDQQPKIIEFGALKINDKLEVIDEMNVMINPGQKLPDIITKITGITDDDLKPAQPFGFHFPKISAFFHGIEAMFAHNLPFDRALLTFELKRLGMENNFPWPRLHLCTVELSRTFFSGKYMKLQNLYEAATGKQYVQKHRALDDCKMLLEVIRWLHGKGVQFT